MVVSLLSIGTAVPRNVLPQERARDFFAAQDGIGRLAGRLIHAAFDQSGIDTRHTAVAHVDGDPTGIFVEDGVRLLAPSTGTRNEVYRREAPELYRAAAVDALARAGLQATDITHVITVSCTGFFAPGPDFRLVKDLGIPTSAERTHIGFMGCAAALPGLRAAARFAAAQPGSNVLVVCAELCSLHIRSSSDPEQIVASAVFADGAAAAIVSSAGLTAPGAALDVGTFATTLTSEGEADMDWTIGDEGFRMVLTANVPKIVGREVRGVFPHDSDPAADFDAWAVHPGGRSILDRVQSGLELSDEAMGPSREVLRKYGNMSSATVLFILQRILDDHAVADGARVKALAFGPGLTVESAEFVKRDAA